MSTFTLGNLATALRSIGRGVVFQSLHWDTTADIALTYLGDTEGDIGVQFNESFVARTHPELTGAAEHAAYVEGAAPVVTMPLYVADPAVRAILSPTGSASGGYERRRPVTYRTLVVFPEELFFDAVDDAYEAIEYTTAGGWTVGGDALTSAQTALLGQAVWLWKGYFATPPLAYKHGEGGKAVESVTFRVVYDPTKPDGHRLWTIGDPEDASIVLDVA